MSCIRSCYDKDSSNFGHDDCPTCIHKDATPQRKPLKFDEVEDCFPDGGVSNEYGEVVVSPQWLHDFASAIQRASHGIKENT